MEKCSFVNLKCFSQFIYSRFTLTSFPKRFLIGRVLVTISALFIRAKAQCLSHGVNSKFLEKKLPNIRDSSHSTDGTRKNSSSENFNFFKIRRKAVHFFEIVE